MMRVIRYWMCVAWLAASAVMATGQAVPAKTATSSMVSKIPSASPALPNLILITLDTTRADRMGFLGSDRGLTPNLDALAKQSAIFTHAYSQAPLTPVSHATILTGTYPQFHQLNDFEVPLAKDLPYAPEVLHAHGYHTAAFVASIVLDPTAGASGFDRGFDAYDAGFHHNGPGEDRFETIERRGSEVIARALAWLSRHPNGPFFLWVHLYDAHDPYDPPEPFKTRYASSPYDGGVAYEDSVFGKFLAELKARALFDGSMIAVMADHGESLGAHGEDTHGIFLYDETIHVPLLIKLPHQAIVEKRIDNRVELVNVMPTLLQAAGIAIPSEVQGESLLGLIKAPPEDAASDWRDRQAYAETDYPRSSFGWGALRSLRAGKYLYVQAPRREVYDQAADPKAEHNLAPESTAVADALSGRLDAFRSKTSNKREAPKAVMDPAAEEKLAALGYVAGRANSAKSKTPGHEVDPKDKVEISNMIDHAEVFLEDGDFQAAEPLLRKVIAKEPDMPGAYGKLGECLIGMKHFKDALPVLRKAVELNPESPVPHFQLAEGLVGAGDFAGAIPELELAVTQSPNFEDAHVFLETAYARTNRVPETIRECRIVLKFRPDHFGSYLILGRFLELSGDLQGAVPNLKKAATLQPKAPEPHLVLADVYRHLGRNADAAREQATAERLAANANQ